MRTTEFKIIELSNQLHLQGIFLQLFVMALLGILASVSLPPLSLFPAILAFVPFLIHSLFSKSMWRMIILFWGFAFGWFTASLYWISASLFVDVSWETLILPFALFALPAFLAMFWGLAGFFVFLCGRTIKSRMLYTAVFIGLAELLRAFLFTGFPWNSPSQLILTHLYLSQIASVIGQNGSVFLILLSVVAFCFLYLRIWKIGLLCILPLLASLCFGALRLDSPSVSNKPKLEQNRHISIRLVQPNVPQKEKWNPEYKQQQIDDLFELSASNDTPVSLIIWPEAAFPSIWLDFENKFNEMSQMNFPKNSHLLSGMLRLDSNKNLYNSALLFNDKGELTGKIDKQKLVPFGEYIPFREKLFLKNLSLFGNKKDISIGPNAKLLSIRDNIKLKVFICYEIIFSELVSSQERPDIMINLTNDAWFGQTLGPYQHLSQARMRAIEEGLPLVRVANTGISAAFDYQGNMLGKINLSEKDVLDLPLSMKQELTIFSKFRWRITMLITFSLVLFTVFLDVRSQARQKCNQL